MHKILIVIGLITMVGLTSARAQQSDEPQFNFNIGGSVGFPVGQAADFANNGGGFQVGAGVNFNNTVGVVVEYMFNHLPIQREVLNALNSPDGDSRIHSVTGNIIVRAPTRGRIGIYGIGGAGWYRRTSELTEGALVPGTACTPILGWYVQCVNGLIPVDVVTASRKFDDFGGNIGGGVTIRLSEGPAKFFTEARYHYAPHGEVSTKLLPIRFGLRW